MDLLVLDSAERERTFRWVSSVDYAQEQKDASKERTEGTGKWLLRHEQNCDWSTSNASQILWLHGDLGTGKTMLVSTIIDDLLELTRRSKDQALAYFYL